MKRLQTLMFVAGSAMVVYTAYKITGWIGVVGTVGLLLIWASGD